MIDKKAVLEKLLEPLAQDPRKGYLAVGVQRAPVDTLGHLCDQLDQLYPLLRWQSGHAPGDRRTPQVFCLCEPGKQPRWLCVSSPFREGYRLTISTKAEASPDYVVLGMQEFCDALENALDLAWSPGEPEESCGKEEGDA